MDAAALAIFTDSAVTKASCRIAHITPVVEANLPPNGGVRPCHILDMNRPATRSDESSAAGADTHHQRRAQWRARRRTTGA